MFNKELFTCEKCNKIFRCPYCFKIPYITPRYIDNKIIVGYKCENNHFGDKEISQFNKDSTNHSIYINNCNECNLSPNQSEKLFNFCLFKDCNKILCSKCKKNHILQGHPICPLYKFDSENIL